jgi:copper chaperone CopZ
MTASGAAGDDALTRTTLRLNGATPGSLVADAIRALHNVPGVLVADVDPARSAIVVAHDGAVPLTALVSAAKTAGVPATIAGRPAVTALATPAGALAGSVLGLRALAPVAALAVAALLAELLLPETASKRAIVYSLALGAWICYFAGVLVRRKSP